MYLPRRSMRTSFAPSSASVNSFLVLWRRMMRGSLTSTPLILRPTASRSRSRRTTSTSGSSGIRGSPRLAEVAVQALDGDARGGLLGLFLRAAGAAAVRGAVEHHRRLEALRVIGSRFAERILGQG